MDTIPPMTVDGRNPNRLNLVVISFTAAFAALQPLASEQPTPSARPLVITSVAVVDVSAPSTKSALKSNQSVLVRDGRIVQVGNDNTIAVPEDARRIDGAGKYLIPGLWDMHAHVVSPQKRNTFLPLYIVNGITSVRDAKYAWRYFQNGGVPYAEWLKYMPGQFAGTWKAPHPAFGAPTADELAQAQANFDKTIEIVGVKHRAGRTSSPEPTQMAALLVSSQESRCTTNSCCSFRRG